MSRDNPTTLVKAGSLMGYARIHLFLPAFHFLQDISSPNSF